MDAEQLITKCQNINKELFKDATSERKNDAENKNDAESNENGDYEDVLKQVLEDSNLASLQTNLEALKNKFDNLKQNAKDNILSKLQSVFTDAKLKLDSNKKFIVFGKIQNLEINSFDALKQLCSCIDALQNFGYKNIVVPLKIVGNKVLISNDFNPEDLNSNCFNDSIKFVLKRDGSNVQLGWNDSVERLNFGGSTLNVDDEEKFINSIKIYSNLSQLNTNFVDGDGFSAKSLIKTGGFLISVGGLDCPKRILCDNIASYIPIEKGIEIGGSASKIKFNGIDFDLSNFDDCEVLSNFVWIIKTKWDKSQYKWKGDKVKLTCESKKLVLSDNGGNNSSFDYFDVTLPSVLIDREPLFKLEYIMKNFACLSCLCFLEGWEDVFKLSDFNNSENSFQIGQMKVSSLDKIFGTGSDAETVATILNYISIIGHGLFNLDNVKIEVNSSKNGINITNDTKSIDIKNLVCYT